MASTRRIDKERAVIGTNVKEPAEIYGFAGYSGIAVPTFAKVNGLLSGSEKYMRPGYEKDIVLKPVPEQNKSLCKHRYVKENCILCGRKKVTRAPGYVLPKSKVSNKINAFCQLNQSLKFLAFYSVTFPSGTQDNTCYKIWNIFLTRLRERYAKFEYIWVVERQSERVKFGDKKGQDNNTIHFHLLTNIWMPIRPIQEIFNSIISKQQWKCNDKAIRRDDIFNLNGVDSRRVRSYKGVRDYMAKKRIMEYEKHEGDAYVGQKVRQYVTKNNTVFDRLTWHCSRLVSSLFTKVIVADYDLHKWADYLEPVQTFEKFEYYRFKKDRPPPDNLFNIRIESNNRVVEKFYGDFPN